LRRLGLLRWALGFGGAKSPPLRGLPGHPNNLVFDINLVVVSPTHVVEEMAKIGTIKLVA